jgi:hypothetical protein
MRHILYKDISNVTLGIDTKLCCFPYASPNGNGGELPHLLGHEDSIPMHDSYWYVRSTVIDSVDWAMEISGIVTKGEELSESRVNTLCERLEKFVEACNYKEFYPLEEFTTSCIVLSNIYNKYLLVRNNENSSSEMLYGLKTEAVYIVYEILSVISRALSGLLEQISLKNK